ncbi:MAG: hypothetical protein AB7R69_00180 [Candidatus Babeliales bacterium]
MKINSLMFLLLLCISSPLIAGKGDRKNKKEVFAKQQQRLNQPPKKIHSNSKANPHSPKERLNQEKKEHPKNNAPFFGEQE